MILARKRFIRRRYSEKDDPNFGITIITAVGLAACGQTNNMDHTKHESTKEKETEKKEMKMNQEVTAPKEINEGASNDVLTTSLKM